MRPGGLSTLVRTCDVDRHNQIPITISHVLEADIAKYACIIDEDVNSPICLDGSLNDLLALDDIVVVCDCLTP